MKQKLIALLLIIHGLITSMFAVYIEDPSGTGVGWNGQSWLLTGILDASVVDLLGRALWIISVITFVLAGIMVLMAKKEWRMVDILASLISLLAYILFWYGLEPVPEYWILGPVISIVTLVALIVVRWPSDEWIFESDDTHNAYEV